MGLKQNIEAMSDEWLEGNPNWDDGYERARGQAAQLAAEADELMAEMAEALRKASSRGNRFAAEYALHKYNQYKDQTND